MTPLRTEIDFLEVMRVLLDLLGVQVSVIATFPGDAGGASITAELFEVVSSLAGGPAVLLRFVEEVALVDLDPEKMTAYQVLGHAGDAWWLEFEIGGQKALTISEVDADEGGWTSWA